MDVMPAQLYLGTKGAASSRQEAFVFGLEFGTVIEEFARSNALVGVFFLDCCHAGAARGQLDELAIGSLHKRAIIFAACDEQSVTFKGLFTKALLEVWRENEAENWCITFDALRESVAEVLSKGEAHDTAPKVLVGGTSGASLCLANLNEPTAVIVFLFPKGIKGAAYVEIPELNFRREYQWDADDPFYVMQIPMRDVTVAVRAGLIPADPGAARPLLYEERISADDMQSPVLCRLVTVPPTYAHPKGPSIYDLLLSLYGDSLAEATSNPAPVYAAVALDPGARLEVRERQLLLDEALTFRPDDVRLQLLAGKISAETAATGGIEDAVLDDPTLLSQLALVGRSESALSMINVVASRGSEERLARWVGDANDALVATAADTFARGDSDAFMATWRTVGSMREMTELEREFATMEATASVMMTENPIYISGLSAIDAERRRLAFLEFYAEVASGKGEASREELVSHLATLGALPVTRPVIRSPATQPAD